MIKTVYPEWVQKQLDIIDKNIERIYNEVLPLSNDCLILNVQEADRIRRCLFERTKPYVDEKVRLIQNCVPKYVVPTEIETDKE